jgi:hypothetical protein
MALGVCLVLYAVNEHSVSAGLSFMMLTIVKVGNPLCDISSTGSWAFLEDLKDSPSGKLSKGCVEA